MTTDNNDTETVKVDTSPDVEVVRSLLRQVSYVKSGTDRAAYDAAWMALTRLDGELMRLREAVQAAYDALPPTGSTTVRGILRAALSAVRTH